MLNPPLQLCFNNKKEAVYIKINHYLNLSMLRSFIFVSMLLGLLAGTTNSVFALAGPFVQCPESARTPNTFALCAIAQCTTIDKVAYCKCEVLNQESISLPYNYTEKGTKKNVCNLLLDGVNNGFTVSTYATPVQVLTDYKPAVEQRGPKMALYTCNPKTNPKALNALSAQCDGGICFNSTSGKKFPGMGKVKSNEIICSCPITKGTSVGFQIAGPYPCNKNFYKKQCEVQSTTLTGTIINVGATTGSASLLSYELDGMLPSLTRCDYK